VSALKTMLREAKKYRYHVHIGNMGAWEVVARGAEAAVIETAYFGVGVVIDQIKRCNSGDPVDDGWWPVKVVCKSFSASWNFRVLPIVYTRPEGCEKTGHKHEWGIIRLDAMRKTVLCVACGRILRAPTRPKVFKQLHSGGDKTEAKEV